MAEEQLGPHAPTSTVYKNGYRFYGIKRDNRLTDRNTVTIIYRSSVFQSVSEPATSLSLSLSLELLGDACEGVLILCMYTMAGSFFMREKIFFPHWCSHFLPSACLNFLYIISGAHKEERTSRNYRKIK